MTKPPSGSTVLPVYFRAAERAVIQAEAQRLGIPESALIRQVALAGLRESARAALASREVES